MVIQRSSTRWYCQQRFPLLFWTSAPIVAMLFNATDDDERRADRASYLALATYVCGVNGWVLPLNVGAGLLQRTPGLRLHHRRPVSLSMAGDVTVQVQSVTSSPMSSNSCVQDVCNQALGFVTCKVTGGQQLVLQEEPLANSYYAVGSADGANFIVPCSSAVEKGSTLAVPSSLAVPVPSGWTDEQAGLFPALCILFLQNLMLEGIDGLSSLKGKTVVVTGGLGPAASLALQLAAASGARVVATGSGGDSQKLIVLGAQQVKMHLHMMGKNDNVADIADNDTMYTSITKMRHGRYC